MELQPLVGLKMVFNNRIDGYVIDRPIGWERVNIQGLTGNIKTIETPFMQQPWYVAFSKQAYGLSRPLIENFWTALAQARIQHSPELEAKYIDVPE